MHSPEVGTAAPALRLPGAWLGERREFSLDEPRTGALVLAFYPGDELPVCIRQLCQYSDDLESLTDVGATVWGISPQSLESHERLARKRGIRLPLLADVGREAAAAYGVDGWLVVKRSIFVIDTDGLVRWTHVSSLGLTYRSSRELVEVIGGLDTALAS